MKVGPTVGELDFLDLGIIGGGAAYTLWPADLMPLRAIDDILIDGVLAVMLLIRKR